MKPKLNFLHYGWPLLLIFFLGAARTGVFFSDNRWDFGTVHQNRLLQKKITITNQSDQNLEVSITGTCDCLNSNPGDLFIWPGQKAEVILTYNPAGDSGKIRKYFLITTSHPSLEKAIFMVQGTVSARPGRKASGNFSTPSPCPDAAQTASPISLVYYYTSGCKKCHTFLTREIPRLEKELGIKITITPQDILQPDKFREYSEKLAALGKKPQALPVILAGNTVLQGEREIKNRLAGLLKQAKTGAGPQDDSTQPRRETGLKPGSNLYLIPVILAGLLDGINPCAFTTLIFLLSYLALTGKNRRQILAIGICFSLGVFGTYYLTGLGLFRVLALTQAVPWMSLGLKWLLALVLTAFAVLSLVDYYKIKAGKTNDLILQLPGYFKQQIHRSVRTRAKSTALIGSSLSLGFLVSILELTCTGQVYFPTIAYMVQTQKQLSAYLLLGVYNFGFILPLLVVFSLTYTGIKSQQLASFFRNHLGKSKLGLAGFFLGLAVLLFVI